MKHIGIVIVMLIGISISGTSNVLGEVSDVDAVSEIWGNEFTAYVQWSHASYENLKIKLYHDGILIAEDATDYRDDFGFISHSPLKTGTYKVQLWSESQGKELFSKEWKVPELQISLSVTPTEGQIGTLFVATTTFSIGKDSPDFYSFSGTLKVDSTVIIRQNIGASLYSSRYCQFWDIEYEPAYSISTSTGLTFSGKGSYSVSAHYTDTLTDISTPSIDVSMDDQYEPQITDLIKQLDDTNKALNTTKGQLVDTNNELEILKETTNEEMETLRDTISTTTTFAYIGIVIGVIGFIVGLVGIILARKAKPPLARPVPPAPGPTESEPKATPPGPTEKSPPQGPTESEPKSPLPESEPKSPPVPSPGPTESEPKSPPVPTSPTNCVQCGKPLQPHTRFCPSCGRACSLR